MKHLFFKKNISLRLIIFLMIALVAVASAIVAVTAAYYDSRAAMIRQRESSMKNQAAVMGNKLLGSGYFLPQSSNEHINLQLAQMASDFDGRVMVIDSSFLVLYDTAGLHTGSFLLDEKVLDSFSKGTGVEYSSESSSFELIMPVVSKNSKTPVGVLILSGGSTVMEDQLEILKDRMVLLGIIISVAVLLISVITAIMIAKPIRHMKDSIDQVRTGDNETVANTGYRETDEIVESFNDAVTKLKNADESRQEFVSNVSHELKTPITSMKILADSLMSMGEAPVELYREFMQDISLELDREAKIINDLLTLVRMDKATGALNIVQTNINELIQSVLHRLQPIAGQRKIELVFEEFRTVVSDADETKLSLAITNLVENAIKYNIDGGFVHVSLNSDHRYMYIKVQDSGVGIPEDEQEHIFDRFYRVDKARSRQTGGTGLGLSIAKSVIQMHKGAIRVHSRVGEGTTFSVRIPLKII